MFICANITLLTLCEMWYNLPKGGVTMALSDARKKANAKWDKENMVTIGCKLKKDVADAFRQYCAEKGTTVNAELRDYVLQCVGESMDNGQTAEQ